MFGRAEWGRLRLNTPLVLSDDDVAGLRGLADPLSLDEVADVYLPLSRLLNLHVLAARRLGAVEHVFLGREMQAPPYVVGIAGSVAVGKSTFARVLRRLLASWPDHPRVELVTTDSFLHPRAVLERRGLMDRKGFPESYDLRRMLAFLSAVKAGGVASAPVYSHTTYDVLPGEAQEVHRPDILLFEGLNVLQTVPAAPLLASDFFDFSVYVDAEEQHIAAWYAQRFLLLQRTAFRQPASYFRHFRDLSRGQALAEADGIWRRINLPNLRENIRPTRERARVILRKGADHRMEEIRLRRV